LANFLGIFNYYIKEFLKKINTRFKIALKNDFSFSISERYSDISYSTLSKGEETVINLLLILSLIKTLKALNGIKFNLLILDEIDGTLDESNLLNIINVLKKLESDILLVSHRKEINEIDGNEFEHIKIHRLKKEIFSKVERE